MLSMGQQMDTLPKQIHDNVAISFGITFLKTEILPGMNVPVDVLVDFNFRTWS